MTRVRKINVSQVEGNGANNTDSYEVRPFGEIGIYENTDNSAIKPELLMFDGNRNNLRSKVLSKGTFYGGDADSGDGNNRDTIKLIPDAVLHRNGGNYGNDQYLIIDPTDGDPVGHIHIRAGGAIDNSTADLFLGGELNNVRVSDTNNRVTITTETTNDIHNWTFDSDGNLTLPIGGDILDSTGESLLAGEDRNIWVQTFESEDGAPADMVAVAASVEYDAAGNVIALFNHNNINGSSYYSVGKFTSEGVKIWTARFADDYNTDGWGLAIDNGDGGGIYIAGSTQPDNASYEQSSLTKLNADNGTVTWSKKYDFGIEARNAVVDVASDGNPVMVGYAAESTDAYIVTTKIDSDTGAPIWSRKLDGQGSENAYGMAVGPAGEIVVIGTMDKLGLGSTNAAQTLAATPTSNVNWTLPGFINAGGLIFDFVFNAGVVTFTVREDPTGNRTIGDQVTTILGSTIGGVDGVDDMIVTVASVNPAVGTMDDRMLVVRYLSDGTIDWQKAVEFDQGYDCEGSDADIDSDGNIYVTGEYDRDVNGGIASALSIVKFDSAGAKQWSRRVEGGCETFGTSIVVGPDNKLYLSGMTLTEQNGKYIWVVAKYGFDGLVEWQRLIENTTSWSFAGGPFFSNGGGSNIAVNQDYVVLAGGFGNLADNELPVATLVQVSAAGDTFAVGNWDFKAATFSGTLNSTASDINMYPGGKTASEFAMGVVNVTLETEVADFLLGTLYRADITPEDRLISNGNQLVLETNGAVTLPGGGTISEGIVTSNPTIQLTPANPDVTSQKLVIKGGGSYIYVDNGIEINYNENTAQVGDTLTFYIFAATYAEQTLYWWIYPEGASISDPGSGTIELDVSGFGTISFEVDSDDYEFTVRVSPTNNQYDSATIGVESGLINPDAPTFDSEHHLHLTTGDLTETSIFLGTDDHNVRTTTDGKIQVTTVNNSNTNHVWTFDTSGQLQLPGSSNGRITEDEPGVVVYSDNGFAVQTGASTPIANHTVEFTGYIDDGTGSTAGSTLTVTAVISGTITDGMTIYGAGLPSEGWVANFMEGSGGVGTYLLSGANYLITSQSFNNGVAADIGPKNWIFDNEGELSFPDGTVQTTAYTGNTTVSKSPSGIPTAFLISTSYNPNLTPGLYPNILIGFTGKNLTLDISVSVNNIISVQNVRNVSPATFTVGDNAVITGDVIGGTTPADDITITVNQIASVDIDLTKTINKLSDGSYTLSLGTEGQIMYLVRQSGSDAANIEVEVARARIDGSMNVDIVHYPFSGGNDIAILIFTDGYWQSTNGAWDI